MFQIHTADPSRLKRIVAAGAGGILTGLFLILFNLFGPLLGASSYGIENLFFALFGVAVVLLATHPTYQAAEKLDAMQ